jgi:DNA-binding NarL/FixJ family response regulator
MSEPGSERIRVAIIDDDPFACEAIGRMLRDSGISIFPLSGSYQECLNSIAAIQPHVVVTDVHPGDDVRANARLIRQIRASSSITACLALATSDPGGILLAEAFYAGARGCLRTGSIRPKGLPGIIRGLAAGEQIIDPSVAGAVLRGRHAADADPARQVCPPLSAEEAHVLRLIAVGSSISDVARSLAMSEVSAKHAVIRIADKCSRR